MRHMNKLAFFENLLSLKIMLVLYRDNPDVTLEKLQSELGLGINELADSLARLINADLVHVRKDVSAELFTLSTEARMGFNRVGLPSGF